MVHLSAKLNPSRWYLSAAPRAPQCQCCKVVSGGRAMFLGHCRCATTLKLGDEGGQWVDVPRYGKLGLSFAAGWPISLSTPNLLGLSWRSSGPSQSLLQVSVGFCGILFHASDSHFQCIISSHDNTNPDAHVHVHTQTCSISAVRSGSMRASHPGTRANSSRVFGLPSQLLGATGSTWVSSQGFSGPPPRLIRAPTL